MSALETLLSQLGEITGLGKVVLSAHALGKLGIAHFHLGDHDRAIAYTRRALALCEESGDSGGIHAYRTNIDHMEQASRQQ